MPLWDDATSSFTGQPQQSPQGMFGNALSWLWNQVPQQSMLPASDPSMGQSMFSAEPQPITQSIDPSIQPTLALRDPERQQQAMDIALSFGPGAIRAFHGSPHDFPAFDMSKIGTGEGAQAYGHGLYFGENPQVADTYRRIGAPLGQNPIHASFVQQAQQQASAAGLVGDEARQSAMGWLDQQAKASRQPGIRQAYYDALNNFDAIGRAPGHGYEVNLNVEPEHLLDWDKPLAEQSEHVKQALAKTPWGKDYTTSNKLTGGQIVPKTPEGAQQLRDAGIPGIRYLDQGSRGAGQGTSNYVMFDDKSIDILRKYAVPGLITGGAAVGAANAENQ